MRLLLLAMLTTIPMFAFSADAAPALPPDEAYVQITPTGRLHRGGEPVRYWGLVSAWAGGGAQADADPDARTAHAIANRARIDTFVQRLGVMGFNLVRCFEGRYPQQRHELPLANNHDYVPGDGSIADSIAYGLFAMDQAGVKIWMSSMAGGLGVLAPSDHTILDDADTAEAWQAAVADLAARNPKEPLDLGKVAKYQLAACVDPRIEALMIARMRQVADFPNHYKGGLRLGDDPQIVVWELSNEHFPFRHFFSGDWQKLPDYFRNQFVVHWNAFLRQRYGDDDGLRAAWGFLLPGESLADDSILLLPLAKPTSGELSINDTNPEVLERLTVRDQQFTRDHFTRQRGADVIRFAHELIISHKQRLDAAVRTFGKSCRLSPMVYDSGNDFSIHAAWMHQHADAVSTCSYTKGMGHDPQARRFPFYSQLEDSPSTAWDVPWFEQSTALNKPHFVYETMIDNRTKYRAEYPLRVATLASIQEWDIVIWHTYPGNDAKMDTPEQPFSRTIVHGFDYFTVRGDEVLIAALRAAGEMFVRHLVPPAPQPRQFVFGSESLYDPGTMDYGQSYGRMANRFTGTTYRYGSRVHIDPTRPDDHVDGHTVRPNVFESNPIKPNEAITFDRQLGYLSLDTPRAASYTGFFADLRTESFTFANGTVISDVVVANPEGIAYPVTHDERYVCINLVALDGTSLADCTRAVVSAVSTSFNPGFTLDLTRSNQGRQTSGPADEPPREFMGAWMASAGKGEPLVARVGCVISHPGLTGMRFVLRDFFMRELGTGTIADGHLVVPADQEVFLIELARP